MTFEKIRKIEESGIERAREREREKRELLLNKTFNFLEYFIISIINQFLTNIILKELLDGSN